MTNQFAVLIPLRVQGPSRAAHFMLVADCYAELEAEDDRLLDSAWSLDDGDDSGDVDVELTVAADDEATAFELASSSVRSAIHHAGGLTPGWGERVPALDAVVYRIRDEADVALV